MVESVALGIEKVVEWVLKHPQTYPGKHNAPNPRTTPAQMPLEPKAQMLIVWRATIDFLKDKLLNGKGIKMNGFGSFTFEINTDLPKIAAKSVSISETLNDQRKERKHLHKLRPCFVVEPGLQGCLKRYSGKEEISKPKSQHSVFQQGFNMVFCNPVPIAAACYLHKDVVVDVHKAIFAAIKDLIRNEEKDIILKFGFCNIKMIHQNLKVIFNEEFVKQVNDKEFQFKMRQSDTQTAEHWKRTTFVHDTEKLKQTMGGMKPETPAVNQMASKTQALKYGSMDMASAKPKGVQNILKLS